MIKKKVDNMSPDPNKGIEKDMEAQKTEELSENHTNKNSSKPKGSNAPAYIFVVIIVLLGLFVLYQYTDVFGKDTDLVDNGGNKIERFSYNEYNFVKNQVGQYSTALKTIKLPDGSPYVVYFRNTPMEVENITITGNFSQFLPS